MLKGINERKIKVFRIRGKVARTLPCYCKAESGVQHQHYPAVHPPRGISITRLYARLASTPPGQSPVPAGSRHTHPNNRAAEATAKVTAMAMPSGMTAESTAHFRLLVSL